MDYGASMQTIETGQPRLGVYVSAMPLMTKPWRGIAALLAAGVVAACSPGAAPVSQSPNDPSNPHAHLHKNST